MEIAIGLYSLAVPFLFEGLGGFFVVAHAHRGGVAGGRAGRPGLDGGAGPGAADPADGRNPAGPDPVRRGGAVAAGTDGRLALCGQHGRRGASAAS